jgi:hypothetical protein
VRPNQHQSPPNTPTSDDAIKAGQRLFSLSGKVFAFAVDAVFNVSLDARFVEAPSCRDLKDDPENARRASS